MFPSPTTNPLRDRLVALVHQRLDPDGVLRDVRLTGPLELPPAPLGPAALSEPSPHPRVAVGRAPLLPTHPHRQPLRLRRARRPGRVPTPPAACLCPIGPQRQRPLPD